MGGKKYLILGMITGILINPTISNAGDYTQREIKKTLCEISESLDKIYKKQKSIDEYLKQIENNTRFN